ncbi:uncharacterized [Tachysurus ichikawai]
MWMKAGPAVFSGLLGWRSDGDFLMDGGNGRLIRSQKDGVEGGCCDAGCASMVISGVCCGLFCPGVTHREMIALRQTVISLDHRADALPP